MRTNDKQIDKPLQTPLYDDTIKITKIPRTLGDLCMISRTFPLNKAIDSRASFRRNKFPFPLRPLHFWTDIFQTEIYSGLRLVAPSTNF